MLDILLWNYDNYTIWFKKRAPSVCVLLVSLAMCQLEETTFFYFAACSVQVPFDFETLTLVQDFFTGRLEW